MNSANCSISAPVIDEIVTCNVSFTRVGSLFYQFPIEIDFGNGYVESLMLTSTNTSLVGVFQTKYQTPGNYVIKLRVPVADLEFNLSNIEIKGLKNVYKIKN